MIKIKKDGFTLSEVLITLAVVGTLAVMVIPGLIKDANNKAMIKLLQNTVTDLNSAIQTEIMNVRTSTIIDTDIWNDQEKFFKKYLDVQRVCTSQKPCFASKTYTLNGEERNGAATNCDTEVLLKNGAAVCLHKYYTAFMFVSIDLNSTAEPNTVGIDIWNYPIERDTNLNTDTPTHAGEIARLFNSLQKSELKNQCKMGNAPHCYTLLEQSGFDPDYINK